MIDPMDANVILQDRFLSLFFHSVLKDDFYLTGDTALARFYFFHRESVDLDLFTNRQEQDFSQVNQLLLPIFYKLDLKINSQVITETFLQYIGVDKTGTVLKVDLVKDVPIHFGENRMVNGVCIDSLENIGSNKILAVFGRTDAKDFIDLYWILNNTDLKFDQLFHYAQAKDTGLSELYLAYALQNLDKISLFPKMAKPLPWDEITIFYQNMAHNLLTQIKPE